MAELSEASFAHVLSFLASSFVFKMPLVFYCELGTTEIVWLVFFFFWKLHYSDSSYKRVIGFIAMRLRSPKIEAPWSEFYQYKVHDVVVRVFHFGEIIHSRCLQVVFHLKPANLPSPSSLYPLTERGKSLA
ncbi:hypothetical protein L228DRAFT_125607 [Xylona heveae TC161]|uniref:Uncharacterized protein n=1 Tax=Xylona heveae (strain CBS 132557 / TC161) TaxID=1328760 RepID=A0A165HS39_XYLHT|nr:hypothetical protein L228DRAFT_125607 [Xylona heveae TC161]KZF23878.1 hypothetical protein L228DRAFT_125607 [Xylona heveae TC161]